MSSSAFLTQDPCRVDMVLEISVGKSMWRDGVEVRWQGGRLAPEVLTFCGLGAFWLVKVLLDQGLQSQRRWSRKPRYTLSVLAGEGARLAGEPRL